MKPSIAFAERAAGMSGGGRTTNLISSGWIPWSRIILCMKKFSLLKGLGIAMVLPRHVAEGLGRILLADGQLGSVPMPQAADADRRPCSRIFMASGTVMNPARSFFVFSASTMDGNSPNRIASNSVPVVLVFDA